MAKIVKMDPDTQSEENKIEKLKQAVWDDFMKGMSEKDKKFVENLNIKSFDDICAFLSAGGFDPLKVLKGINESETLEEFQSKDLSFDEDDPRSDFSSHGPRQLFLDEKDVKEYHIRIKLDNAPVKIWRELKVPSNISLEYLAKLLIEAMGWFDSHLHQFRKKDVFYKSTEDLEYEKENFFSLKVIRGILMPTTIP